ncbi:hypothetical protein SKAU_G00159630 [Synaphobranchus kaupii]|uniref:Uncharacterized protein n=1 Tax=Synaphobranchus kaupii TaxID=118154 RepID=A0A9Q1FI88_SYNKA|nr:hypothetical protein SKAU_G00159630 [Synaphobranchus kaupii]
MGEPHCTGTSAEIANRSDIFLYSLWCRPTAQAATYVLPNTGFREGYRSELQMGGTTPNLQGIQSRIQRAFSSFNNRQVDVPFSHFEHLPLKRSLHDTDVRNNAGKGGKT